MLIQPFSDDRAAKRRREDSNKDRGRVDEKREREKPHDRQNKDFPAKKENEREPERLSSKIVGSVSDRRDERSRDFLPLKREGENNSDRISSKIVGSIPDRRERDRDDRRPDRSNFENAARERSDRRERERMDERERRFPPSDRGRHFEHDMRDDRGSREGFRPPRGFDRPRNESSARGWATQGNNFARGPPRGYRGGNRKPRGGRNFNPRREQDPLNIPKSGYYYEHDNREGDAEEAGQTGDKKTWETPDKWTHDRYQTEPETAANTSEPNQNSTETNQPTTATEQHEETAEEERPVRRRRFEETENKDQLEDDSDIKEHGSPISEEHLV